MDDLVLTKKEVTVCGKKYEIGKITVGQVVSLVKLLAGSFDSLRANIKEGMGNQEAAGALFASLNEDTINQVVCLLIGDSVQCIPFEDALEVVAVACEINDIDKILKNVQRVTTAFQREKK